MKTIVLSVIVLAFFASCNTTPKTELHAVQNVKGTAVYGDSVKNNNVIVSVGIRINPNISAKTNKNITIPIKNPIGKYCKKPCLIFSKFPSNIITTNEA